MTSPDDTATSPGAAAAGRQPALDAALGSGAPVPGTLMERLGIVVEEMSATRVVASMPVAGNLQPAGLLHGGASAALAETVGSYAAQLHAGPRRLAVGVDLNATHHRGVREGTVRAVATALRAGATVATYGVEVRDDAERLVCTARLTCVVRDATGDPTPGAADRRQDT